MLESNHLRKKKVIWQSIRVDRRGFDDTHGSEEIMGIKRRFSGGSRIDKMTVL